MAQMRKKAPNRALLPCGRIQEEHVHSTSPSNREQWRERLSKHLASQGLKHSEQRLKIVELILSEERHFSVQEILKKIQAKYPEIGMATVYRSVKLLVEAEILKETLVGDGREQVYELASADHHDHIVCLDCGSIFEFHSEEIEARQEKLTQKMGFTEVRHRHVVYARCQLFKAQSGSK